MKPGKRRMNPLIYHQPMPSPLMKLALIAILLLLPQPQAWAWGSEGHRIIADIAWHHLNDTALENLRPQTQRPSGLHIERSAGPRNIHLRIKKYCHRARPGGWWRQSRIL